MKRSGPQQLLFFLGTLVILALLGRSAPIVVSLLRLPTEIPNDFAVTFEDGPCHAKWGKRLFVTVQIQDSEKAKTPLILTWGYSEYERDELGRGAMIPTVEGTSELKRQQSLAVYREIVWQRFFELDESYRDPDTVDGNCRRLTICANGRNHTVWVSNRRLAPFDQIVTRLLNLPVED